jgi:hypothetical protein
VGAAWKQHTRFNGECRTFYDKRASQNLSFMEETLFHRFGQPRKKETTEA